MRRTLNIKRQNTYDVVYRRADSSDKSEYSIGPVAADTLVGAANTVRRNNPQNWPWFRVEVVAVKLTGTVWSVA